MKKVAFLLSRPGANLSPLLRKLYGREDVKPFVYFQGDWGTEKEFDPTFGVEVDWGVPLLDGFAYKILGNIRPGRHEGFWGQINPGIVPALWRSHFDAVVIHGWNSITNWLAFFAAFFSGTAIFLTSESPLCHEHSKKRGMRQMARRWALRRLFGHVRAFLFLGEENRKFYLSFGVPESKLFFYPYAVDTERLFARASALAPERDALRKKFGIARDAVVVLFVGRLVPQKRPQDLLAAFERAVAGASSGAKKLALVLVGEGELRAELENYVCARGLQNVLFAGFRNKVELPNFFALSDIFILPSGLGETWGVVVNEALCFGLPVVVSDLVGSGPDLVKPGENGFIFPTGDTEALAGHLVDLAGDEKKRRRFGEKSRALAGHHTYEEDVKGLFRALNHV